MSQKSDAKKYRDEAYCGRIFHGSYSDVLMERVAQCIDGFRLFEETGNPAIPYISAWQEDEKVIWYEFVGRRFIQLFNCSISELAETFRNSIVERRVYRHLNGTGGVEAESIAQEEINGTRQGLRNEGKREGLVEAIYKVALKDGSVIWLKDQATVETFEEDRVSISLGCLTDVSKEMEAEEALKRTELALQKANEKLQQLATMDGLTGIANRRRFDDRLQQEWRRLGREGAALSLILCDIDHFKLYNDTYGHQAGDDCLRAVAGTMADTARRPADLVARYGGEEFAVILPNTDMEGAVRVAQEIRAAVKEKELAHNSSPVSPVVTLSLGVTTAIPNPQLPPESLVERADQALYEAKEQGRDRVVQKEMTQHSL
jgi:diguanylate cyclase (GGDEF)-like protein